jgi:mannitol/fructose-specific phosphotransferase system IIA component (Ntr-type)
MNAFGRDILPNTICIFKESTTKFDALEEMIDALMTTGAVRSREALRTALFEREAIRSTGFRSVAIPHVRIDEISEPTVAIGVSKAGIDFEALDSEPVNIVVLFAMPSGSDKEYLGLLAQVMMTLRTPGFCEKLIECDEPGDVIAVLAD